MDEIGAYAFITSDFKQKGYPFDLWLEWNSRFFDKMAVISYGEVKIPHYDNVLIISLTPPEDKGWRFYTEGKKKAQELLDTEWKVMLDTDEFISSRITTKGLDKSKVYALHFHHLYGNLNTEIIGAFPEYYFRMHTGTREILNDGGSVSGTKEWGGLSIGYLASTFLGSSSGVSWEIQKFMTLVKKDGLKRAVLRPKFAGEVFHTNTLRDPKSLKLKWKEQSIRSRMEGKSMKRNDSLEEKTLDENTVFDYGLYKTIWKYASLRSLPDNEIPEILRSHSERFNWHDFKI